MARHGIYPRDIIPPVSDYYDSGRFGRMFGKLPAFSSDTPRIRKALMDIGAVDGPMDAKEDLGADPKDLIVDLNLSANNNNNPKLSAGMTFLGQFLDHDMTFDPTSSLERQVDPEHIANFRTPSLALDNVYGAGPGGSPHLYDRTDGDKFLLEETGTPGKYDVPRNSQMLALIGDPRDDENLIISQLDRRHCARAIVPFPSSMQQLSYWPHTGASHKIGNVRKCALADVRPASAANVR